MTREAIRRHGLQSDSRTRHRTWTPPGLKSTLGLGLCAGLSACLYLEEIPPPLTPNEAPDCSHFPVEQEQFITSEGTEFRVECVDEDAPEDLRFRWNLNGRDLPATGSRATVNLEDLEGADSATLAVIVRDTAGSTASASWILTVETP